MTELFANISKDTKKWAQLFFDYAINNHNHNPALAVKILDAYTNNLEGEDKDFTRFYFNMRM